MRWACSRSACWASPPSDAVRQALRALALPLAVAVATALAFRAPLPYFTEQPGAMFGLAERVRVGGYDDKLSGEVLFGTVNVRTATLARAVRAALDRNVTLVRRERFLPEGLNPQAFFDQQRAEFLLAADVAAAVGLRAAGLMVDPDALRGEGALVLRVDAAGPVLGRIRAGDVITEVDGQPVTTDVQYRALLDAGGWDPVTLSVRRGERVTRVELAPAANRRGEPSLGLTVSTFRPSVDLPVPVRVDNARVGGPSAGLAVALTVYDVAAPEDLLAGRDVMATGSIDPAGRVGPIGGVEFKAVAAERAGIDLLLVPAEQAEAARDAVDPDAPLRIVGVASFSDALAALREPAAAVRAAHDAAVVHRAA